MTNLPKWEISHIGIYVTDMDRMRDFYTALLGFKVIETATHNRIASDPSTRPFADWRADKQREFERTN